MLAQVLAFQLPLVAKRLHMDLGIDGPDLAARREDLVRLVVWRAHRELPPSVPCAHTFPTRERVLVLAQLEWHLPWPGEGVGVTALRLVHVMAEDVRLRQQRAGRRHPPDGERTRRQS